MTGRTGHYDMGPGQWALVSGFAERARQESNPRPAT